MRVHRSPASIETKMPLQFSTMIDFGPDTSTMNDCIALSIESAEGLLDCRQGLPLPKGDPPPPAILVWSEEGEEPSANAADEIAMAIAALAAAAPSAERRRRDLRAPERDASRSEGRIPLRR
jgi:hypothetical protein